MSKAEELAKKYCKGSSFEDACMEKPAYIAGYHQAEKDVTEAFARIIRGNLSMIDEKVQAKFEHLYTEITGEKMYKGFKD